MENNIINRKSSRGLYKTFSVFVLVILSVLCLYSVFSNCIVKAYDTQYDSGGTIIIDPIINGPPPASPIDGDGDGDGDSDGEDGDLGGGEWLWEENPIIPSICPEADGDGDGDEGIGDGSGDDTGEDSGEEDLDNEGQSDDGDDETDENEQSEDNLQEDEKDSGDSEQSDSENQDLDEEEDVTEEEISDESDNDENQEESDDSINEDETTNDESMDEIQNNEDDQEYSSPNLDVQIEIDGKICFLIDSDGNGEIDSFKCPETGVSNLLGKTAKGMFLIDSNNDDKWDHIYDFSIGEVKIIQTSKDYSEASSSNDMFAVYLVASVGSILVVLLVYWVYSDQKRLTCENKD